MMYSDLFKSKKFEEAVNTTVQAARNLDYVVMSDKDKKYAVVPDGGYYCAIYYLDHQPVVFSEDGYPKDMVPMHFNLPLLGAVTTVFCNLNYVATTDDLDSITVEYCEPIFKEV